jgi:hypothetical protein
LGDLERIRTALLTSGHAARFRQRWRAAFRAHARRCSTVEFACLRAKATDLFEKADRENNAWRATHVTAIARRHAIFQGVRSPFGLR